MKTFAKKIVDYFYLDTQFIEMFFQTFVMRMKVSLFISVEQRCFRFIYYSETKKMQVYNNLTDMY